jgi:hypothetical protein
MVKDRYRQLHVKVNAKWTREFLTHTPAEVSAQSRVPVLAITGSKDIQIDPAELGRMAELAQCEFESHEIPDVTHMLRADMSPGKSTLKTYSEHIRKPVDSRILAIISVRQKGQVAA